MQKIVKGVIGFDEDFTPGDCERCRFSYYNDDYTSVYCVFDCSGCPLYEFDLPENPDETVFFICPDRTEAEEYVDSLMSKENKK